MGFAESYRGQDNPGGQDNPDDGSVLAGTVYCGEGSTEWFGFTEIEVGGLDSTSRILELYRELGRDDINYVMVSGFALAWYNVVDLREIHRKTGIPTVSVTYEDSSGLEESIETEFSGKNMEKRLRLYSEQPERMEVNLSDGRKLYARFVGGEFDEITSLMELTTPGGARPEPLRTAKFAARGVLNYREKLQGEV